MSTRLVRLPLERQLRLLFVVVLAFIPVVAATSTLTLLSQSYGLNSLARAVGPAVEANDAALTDMARARADLASSLAGAAGDHRALRPDVESDLADLRSALGRPEIEDSDREPALALADREESAASAWFTAADEATAGTDATAGARTRALARADRAWLRFQRSQDALAADLTALRSDLRSAVHGSLLTQVVVTAALAGLALVLVVLGSRLLSRSVTIPLSRLRAAMRRQQRGDTTAFADPGAGAEELRGLARDFNELVRSNTVLLEDHAHARSMQELTLEVAHHARAPGGADEALRVVCELVGQGLGADRALLYTLTEDGTIAERNQWHAGHLPPLPPLPTTLAAEAVTVSEELMRSGRTYVETDFLAPRVQEQERARRFHRATGAASVLFTPVGLRDEGLGLMCVMMTGGPRRWREDEAQAVQQCAGYVAQAVVQQRLLRMQELQVQRLTELDRQKTDFVATVSHELRTPLTSISGYLELLEDGDYGRLSAPQAGALGIIHRNTDRLRELIEDLLEINRIEGAGLHPSSERLAVGDLVGNLTEVLTPTATEKGVRLAVDPVPEDLAVHVDRAHLERALLNVGSNAVKFTPAGGRVHVAARAGESGDVVITVVDTGIGVPAGDLPRLSERFFRASNATARQVPGSGLGLTIVQSIVEGHGGRVEYDSVEGSGTTVILRLPRHD